MNHSKSSPQRTSSIRPPPSSRGEIKEDVTIKTKLKAINLKRRETPTETAEVIETILKGEVIDLKIQGSLL